MQNDPGPSGSRPTADMMITHAHSLLINMSVLFIPMENSDGIDPIGYFLDRDLSYPLLSTKSERIDHLHEFSRGMKNLYKKVGEGDIYDGILHAYFGSVAVAGRRR